MTILQKIRDWRKNHRIASAIFEGAAVFTAANVAGATLDALVQPQTQIVSPVSDVVAGVADAIIPQAHADFYDGARGPRKYQIDQRLIFDGSNAPTYKLLPKLFSDDDGDGTGIFGVAPFIYTPKQKPAMGAGVGVFHGFDLGSLLAVLPVVHSLEGKTTNINPTLYVTLMPKVGEGYILIDPRVSYNLGIGDDGSLSHNVNAGLTLGYQHGLVIVGVDVNAGLGPSCKDASKIRQQLKDSLEYGGIVRIDLDKDHSNWLQTYATNKGVTLAWRTNF